jgi:hypothetical protein
VAGPRLCGFVRDTPDGRTNSHSRWAWRGHVSMVMFWTRDVANAGAQYRWGATKPGHPCQLESTLGATATGKPIVSG